MGTAGDILATAREAATAAREPLIVIEPLEAFLDRHQLGEGAVSARPIGAGHSNVTYLLKRGEQAMVLRRPPRGPLPRSAHDVLREARVMRSMRRVGVPVPHVLATCDDHRVLGAPFYVMEYVAGHVLEAAVPEALEAPGARERIAFEVVDALAHIHTVDWRASGIASARTAQQVNGYLARQVGRFAGLWERNATRELPELERVTGWLRRTMPMTSRTTAVHGDYRLGNVMFVPEGPPRVAAVLDWEMATVGDPMADLGYLLAMYARPDDEPNPMLALSSVTTLEGFPSRETLRERYEERSGLPAWDVRFYEVLALWKSAIFLEGSWRRYRAGRTDDPWFATLGEGVPALARRALSQTMM